MWAEYEDYLNVIHQSRSEEIQGNPNPKYVMHQKTRRVCRALDRWSRSTFGDIYEKLIKPKKLEKLIKELEETSITNNSQDIRNNLSRAKAQFTRFLILQEKVLRHVKHYILSWRHRRQKEKTIQSQNKK